MTERDPQGRSLSELLANGEIDVIMGTQHPHPHPDIAPLFADARGVEREFAKTTRIFPMMHLVVIRRDVYERDRSVADRLYKGFVDAKNLALARLKRGHPLMLPWLHQDIHELDEVFGGVPAWLVPGTSRVIVANTKEGPFPKEGPPPATLWLEVYDLKQKRKVTAAVAQKDVYAVDFFPIGQCALLAFCRRDEQGCGLFVVEPETLSARSLSIELNARLSRGSARGSIEETQTTPSRPTSMVR